VPPFPVEALQRDQTCVTHVPTDRERSLWKREGGYVLRQKGAGPSRGSGGPAPPCLNSNNCPDEERILLDQLMRLKPQARKTARLLKDTVMRKLTEHTVEKVVFLTLTIDPKRARREGWDARDPKACQRKFKAFVKSFLAPVCRSRYVRVVERQKNGNIHFHLLIVVDFDARSGTDWEKLKLAEQTGDDSLFAESLNPACLALWRSLGTLRRPGVAQECGFGIVRPEPIKSTQEAVSKYVGKYISKHIEQRCREDKGLRLVEYGRPMRIGNTHFAWISEGARQWRTKLPIFARSKGVENYEGLSEAFGPRWAYHFKDAIMETALPVEYVFPSHDCAKLYVRHRQDLLRRELNREAFAGLQRVDVVDGLTVKMNLRGGATLEITTGLGYLNFDQNKRSISDYEKRKKFSGANGRRVSVVDGQRSGTFSGVRDVGLRIGHRGNDLPR